LAIRPAPNAPDVRSMAQPSTIATTAGTGACELKHNITGGIVDGMSEYTRFRLRFFFPVSESDLLLFAAYTRNPLRNWVFVLLSAKAGLRAGETALGFAAALCKSRIPTQTADASLLRYR
jgi:hypothetical protein